MGLPRGGIRAGALSVFGKYCLNSRENFEENKNFLRKRAEEERNPVIRKLLERGQ